MSQRESDVESTDGYPELVWTPELIRGEPAEVSRSARIRGRRRVCDVLQRLAGAAGEAFAEIHQKARLSTESEEEATASRTAMPPVASTRSGMTRGSPSNPFAR